MGFLQRIWTNIPFKQTLTRLDTILETALRPLERGIRDTYRWIWDVQAGHGEIPERIRGILTGTPTAARNAAQQAFDAAIRKIAHGRAGDVAEFVNQVVNAAERVPKSQLAAKLPGIITKTASRFALPLSIAELALTPTPLDIDPYETALTLMNSDDWPAILQAQEKDPRYIHTHLPHQVVRCIAKIMQDQYYLEHPAQQAQFQADLLRAAAGGPGDPRFTSPYLPFDTLKFITERDQKRQEKRDAKTSAQTQKADADQIRIYNQLTEKVIQATAFLKTIPGETPGIPFGWIRTPEGYINTLAPETFPLLYTKRGRRSRADPRRGSRYARLLAEPQNVSAALQRPDLLISPSERRALAREAIAKALPPTPSDDYTPPHAPTEPPTPPPPRRSRRTPGYLTPEIDTVKEIQAAGRAARRPLLAALKELRRQQDLHPPPAHWERIHAAQARGVHEAQLLARIHPRSATWSERVASIIDERPLSDSIPLNIELGPGLSAVIPPIRVPKSGRLRVIVGPGLKASLPIPPPIPVDIDHDEDDTTTH